MNDNDGSRVLLYYYLYTIDNTPLYRNIVGSITLFSPAHITYSYLCVFKLLLASKY